MRSRKIWVVSVDVGKADPHISVFYDEDEAQTYTDLCNVDAMGDWGKATLYPGTLEIKVILESKKSDPEVEEPDSG